MRLRHAKIKWTLIIFHVGDVVGTYVGTYRQHL